MCGGRTRLAGVLGNPVRHSLSPAMHNAAFRHLDLDLRYMAFEVPCGELRTALDGLRMIGAVGVNVTVPFKEEALALVDEVDDAARKAGAVNTVVFRDGRSLGFNTDVAGVRRAVADLDSRRGTALLLGAGGAARAAAIALAEEGFSAVWIANRNTERAERLIADLGEGRRKLFHLLPWGEMPPLFPDLLINATSLGLEGNPFPSELLEILLPCLSAGRVLDMVYSHGKPTSLIWAFLKRGIPALAGESVLLYQGAEAFRLFTGLEAPTEVMRRALEESAGNI